MKVTILGCGTSGGVPKMPLHWGACDPNNPKNRRSRASILIEEGDTTLLVDTSPDLREQMIRENVQDLSAVFYTHDHADHTHGIDDLRGFFQRTREKLPTYADQATLDLLKTRFGYIFKTVEGYPSICSGHAIKGNVKVGPITMQPFEQIHGNSLSTGFRFGDIAYSTDLNALPESSFDTLAGVKVWIVDALRHDPHPTHSHLAQTLEWIARVKPERAILTHMTWDLDYEALKKILPEGVEPAYDGMTIEL